MEEEYKFPVWGTQGGGLAYEFGGSYFFIEPPAEETGLKVGDEVPEEWDLAPANELARNKMV